MDWGNTYLVGQCTSAEISTKLLVSSLPNTFKYCFNLKITWHMHIVLIYQPGFCPHVRKKETQTFWGDLFSGCFFCLKWCFIVFFSVHLSLTGLRWTCNHSPRQPNPPSQNIPVQRHQHLVKETSMTIILHTLKSPWNNYLSSSLPLISWMMVKWTILAKEYTSYYAEP